MQTKLIIYDFDGVLVDSHRAVYCYYDAVFTKFNLPLIDWEHSELGKLAYGLTHVQLLSRYATGAELEAMLNYVPDITQEELIAISPLEKGVLEALPELAKSCHLAICTNRGHSIKQYLDHYDIESFFPYVITASDVASPKPDPEGAQKIMAHYGVSTAESIFIGDSEADYFAAKDAGVRFISFNSVLFGSPIIHDHREVKKYL
ncbi:MAG: HAD family hydrolase [Deferribacteraceae bacterium]|jgi:HAD superfamily hydrolase (TIGR01509 family)|nr:HAD family hydrolase [Deferribacteraceae bacterium]